MHLYGQCFGTGMIRLGIQHNVQQVQRFLILPCR